MLTGQFTMEDAQWAWRSDGVEEGMEKGLVIGREEGMQLGEERGIQIGEERGMRLGIERRNLEMARRMRELGAEMKLIVAVTGLGEVEILRL
ncbi:MAG: hypothetical protein LBS11_10260 [Oscillospiraceae bacterium]|jgi:predicted transposase YdaD|nr:hypothetical protein [Oscillospiraceae bacterium]